MSMWTGKITVVVGHEFVYEVTEEWECHSQDDALKDVEFDLEWFFGSAYENGFGGFDTVDVTVEED